MQSPFVTCDFCGDGHATNICPGNSSSLINSETANFVGNFNRDRNDPYSNFYNPGWRNHPNFSWSNQGNAMTQRQNRPPGFQNQARAPPQEKKPSIEEIMLQYMAKQILLCKLSRLLFKPNKLLFGCWKIIWDS